MLLLLHRKIWEASSLYDYFWNFMDIEILPNLTVRFQRGTLTFFMEFRVCHSSKYWLIFQKRKRVPFSLLIWWIIPKKYQRTLHKLTYSPGPLILSMSIKETPIPHMVTWSFWKPWMKWMRHDIAASKFADEPRIANKISTLLF